MTNAVITTLLTQNRERLDNETSKRGRGHFAFLASTQRCLGKSIKSHACQLLNKNLFTLAVQKNI